MRSHLSRTGVFTPVVLMVLAVFAILGVTYSFTGASSYSVSAQVIYQLKASLLAQAALEEAQAVVYDKVNLPSKGRDISAAWKQELLGKVQSEVKAPSGGKETATGPIKIQGADKDGWIDLLKTTKGVEKYKTLVTELGGEAEVTECKVKFYGFHRIAYNATGDVYKPESYYKNDFLDKDNPDLIPADFIGYYTIRASARSNKQTKSFAVTHDIKIVNVAPIAHDFALFQMADLSKDTGYGDTDLNKGGAFRVYPRGWGREYMRGPYTVESEGLPGGEGGYGPATANDPKMTVSNYFLRILNKSGDLEWQGWHMIPTPRAGVPKRAALVFPKPQVRPKTAQTSIGATFVGEITNNIPVVSAVGSAATALGADPGLYISENQVWYTGFKDPTNKDFSLVGDVRGDPAQGFGFSGFRGEQFKLVAGDQSKKEQKAYWPVEELEKDGGSKQYRYVGQYIADPPKDKDANWYIAPEAFLKIKCHVVRFKHPGINWSDLIRLRNPFNFSYNLALDDTSATPGGVATQLYALHWEPERTRGFLDSLLDGIKSLTPGFFFLNPAFLIFNMDPRQFFSGGVPGGPDDFKDVRPKSLPTNFKGVWSRAATRMYKRASRIRSVVDATKAGGMAKLLLDGVVWSRELKLDTPISYTGKGILGSEPNPDVTTQDATVTGPVVPSRDRLEEAQAHGEAAGSGWEDENKRWTTDNYLTVVYQGAAPIQTGGSQMVTLKIKSTGSTAPVFDGTYFSTHGVKPDAGQTATIRGNLIVGVINKQKIPDNSTMTVDYHDRLLPRRLNEAADTSSKLLSGGTWHNCSVSPRVAGYFEK